MTLASLNDVGVHRKLKKLNTVNIIALDNLLWKHRVKLHGKALRSPLACFRWDANWMGGGNPIMCYSTELLDWLLWCLLKSWGNPLVGKGSVLLGMRAIKQTEQEHADSWGSPCRVVVSLKTSAQQEHEGYSYTWRVLEGNCPSRFQQRAVMGKQF